MVERLDAIDPAAFGLIREQEGGFPRTMWRGSDRAQVERLLAQLKPSASPTALTLMRRLLLSENEPPVGQAGEPGLFEIRIDRLVAAGAPDTALKLALLAGNNPKVQRHAVDAALAAGNTQEACRLNEGLPGERRDAQWGRTSAFCKALAGDAVGAGILAGLLRERGESDPVFATLLGSLTGFADDSAVDLKNPSALSVAMLKAAKRQPTPASLAGMGPAALKRVSEIEGLSPEIAVVAVEGAYELGAAPAEALAGAYGKLQFKPAELASALSGKPAADPKGRAALFQAVTVTQEIGARGKALVAAFERLRNAEGGWNFGLSQVYLPTLTSIRPEADQIALGPWAARLMLGSGQSGPAREWLQLLEWEGRTGTVDAARAAVRLMPLFRIADRTAGRFAPGELVDWIDAWRAGARPEGFDARAVTALSALQGLGYDVPVQAWDKIVSANALSIGRRPNAATIQALRGAAHGGRLGETVLLVLAALDGKSAAALEADALSTVLDSLIRVDLEAEARGLAIEAIIGLGL